MGLGSVTEAGLQGLKEGRDGEGRAHAVDQQAWPHRIILWLRTGGLAGNRPQPPEPPAWLQVTPVEGVLAPVSITSWHR